MQKNNSWQKSFNTPFEKGSGTGTYNSGCSSERSCLENGQVSLERFICWSSTPGNRVSTHMSSIGISGLRVIICGEYFV